MKHLSNWIEISVTNLSRTSVFYSTIFGGISFFEMSLGTNHYALLPAEDKYNCRALAEGDWYKPRQDGVTVYLNRGEALNKVLDKVAKAGEAISMEKTNSGDDIVYIGMFIDSEGNRIGLYNN